MTKTVYKQKKLIAAGKPKKKATAKKMTDAELRAKAIAAVKAGAKGGKADLMRQSKTKGAAPSAGQMAKSPKQRAKQRAKPKAKPKKKYGY